MRNIPWLLVLLAVGIGPTAAFANHEPTPTNDNGEAALLLSSTSTTTMAVVGGIILTVMMASDSESMEQYLKENAVALESDLTLGAGETVDDLALAFGVSSSERARFGKLVRTHHDQLLDLADPDKLDLERARNFVVVLLRASVEADIVSMETLEAS